MKAWKIDKESTLYGVMKACKVLTKKRYKNDSYEWNNIFYKGETHEIVATDKAALIIYTDPHLEEMFGSEDGKIDLAGEYIIFDKYKFPEWLKYTKILSEIKVSKKKYLDIRGYQTPSYYLCEVLAEVKIIMTSKLLGIIDHMDKYVDKIFIQDEPQGKPVLLKGGSTYRKEYTKLILMPRKITTDEFKWEDAHEWD